MKELHLSPKLRQLHEEISERFDRVRRDIGPVESRAAPQPQTLEQLCAPLMDRCSEGVAEVEEVSFGTSKHLDLGELGVEVAGSHSFRHKAKFLIAAAMRGIESEKDRRKT